MHQITWGHAYDTQPFGNVMQVVDIKGQYLLDALREQQRNRAFLHMSGMTYYYTLNDERENDDDPDAQIQDQLVVLEDGSLLDPDQTYRIVLNDFLYAGGDNFSAFSKGELVGVMGSDTDTLVEYIQTLHADGKKVAAEIDGRKQLTTHSELDDRRNEANQKAADQVLQQILALPDLQDIRLSHEDAIGVARKAFDALTQEQQALVNIERLLAAEKRLKQIQSDRTPPTITGVQDGQLYTQPVTVQYNDNVGILEALHNDQPFESGVVIASNGTHTIVVTDLAENQTTVSFTLAMSPKETEEDDTQDPGLDQDGTSGESPQTGDSNLVRQVITLMVLSTAGIAAAAGVYRHRKRIQSVG